MNTRNEFLKVLGFFLLALVLTAIASCLYFSIFVRIGSISIGPHWSLFPDLFFWTPIILVFFFFGLTVGYFISHSSCTIWAGGFGLLFALLALFIVRITWGPEVGFSDKFQHYFMYLLPAIASFLGSKFSIRRLKRSSSASA